MSGAREAARLGIYKQMRALRSSLNELTPIFQLPLELLLLVFKYVQLDKPYSYYGLLDDFVESTFGRDRWAEMRDISHVCRHWRLVTLDNPSLWSRIDCSDSPIVMREMLSRSKSSPFSITIGDKSKVDSMPSSLWFDLLDAGRLQSLRLSLPYDHIQDVLDAITSSGDSAPRLRSIFINNSDCISHEVPVSPILSILTPQLQYLDLSDCSVSWDLGFQCTSLVSLRLQHVNKPSKGQLYTLLGSNTNLESLYIEESFPEIPSDTKLPNRLPLGLPRLSSCTIKGTSISECLDFQAHVLYPASTAHLHFTPFKEAATASRMKTFLSSLGDLSNNPRSSCLCLDMQELPRIIFSRLPSSQEGGWHWEYTPHPHDESSATLDLRDTAWMENDDEQKPQWLDLLSVPCLQKFIIFDGSGSYNADQFLDFFRRHPEITDLTINDSDPQPILTALLNGGRGSDPPIPPATDSPPSLLKLVNLRMQHFSTYGCDGEEFAAIIAQLYEYLSRHRKYGTQIQQLEFIDCPKMDRATVKILEGEVGQVVWHEKVPVGVTKLVDVDVDESSECDSEMLDDDSWDKGGSGEED